MVITMSNIEYLYRIILFVFISLIFISCSSKNIQFAEKATINYPDTLNNISQEDWGGIENQETAESHKIERITLHHGGVEFTADKDPIEYMRNLQSWSRTEKKWIDIPYHFLIDLDGKIYEGRSLKHPGDTNTNYDPSGHLLICLMGNYEIQLVNSEQFEALTNLITFFCKELDISTELIKGHKDYTETACPGKDFYKYLENDSLVIEVKEKLKISL